MSSIDGIPSYVMQNMSMIQDNIKTIMADNLGVGGAKADFDGFLNSAIGDIGSTFSDSDFELDTRYQKNAYGHNDFPGASGNMAKPADLQQIMNQQMNKANTSNAESTAAIDKAYDSILNGDLANKLAPTINSTEDNSVNELKKIKGNSTSLVTDSEFFDANALTPEQITSILKEKGSPYAYRTYEGGKTVGQLIYDECHKAGTVDQGPHKLNPALIISIMGAESSFGTDPKAFKNNPFNIRVNGSFSNVNKFEQSLNMAVNTMYNWAMDRPKDSKLSFLDYAGDKYCENYKAEWKPNVEKYFTQFTLNNSPALPEIAKKPDNNQQMINQIVSSMSNIGKSANTESMGGGMPGMNIDMLMKMAKSKANNENPADNMNMVSSLTPNLNSFGDENKDE